MQKNQILQMLENTHLEQILTFIERHYTNVQSYRRAFKRRFGITPSEYILKHETECLPCYSLTFSKGITNTR